MHSGWYGHRITFNYIERFFPVMPCALELVVWLSPLSLDLVLTGTDRAKRAFLSNEHTLENEFLPYRNFTFNMRYSINIHLTYMCVSVQLLSHVRLFTTLWITARQAYLSITNSQSSPILMFIESVMPSSHLILCHPHLLLPPIPPTIRVFSNESTLRMR